MELETWPESSAHSRENKRYFAEKVHFSWESSWNGWKTAGTRIKASNQQQASSKQASSSNQSMPLELMINYKYIIKY